MEYLLKKGNVVKKTLSEERVNALQASGFELIQKNNEINITPEIGEKSDKTEIAEASEKPEGAEVPEAEEKLEEDEALEDKNNQESAEVEKESKSRGKNKKTEETV